MFTCQLCLKEFKRKDNMLRHLKTMHDESDPDVSDQESDSDTPLDSDFPTDSETPSDLDSEDPWDDLVSDTFKQCDSKYGANVKDYMTEKGVSEEEARQHVFRNMRDTFRKALASILTERVLCFNALRKDPIYKTIKRTVSDLQTEHEYDEEEAWKYGISKRKFALDKVLKEYDPPELSETETSERVLPSSPPQQDQTGGASISIVSPAQQTVDMARSILERPLKKRKMDYPSNEGVYVIGKR